MDKRLQKLEDWLANDLELAINSLQPASTDAGFRRYFRVKTDSDVYIVMDAPPELEPIADFVAIASQLGQLGVHTPVIHHQDIRLGFLVLEDLGSTTFLDALSNGIASKQKPNRTEESLLNTPNTLYESAIDALIKIQAGYLSTESLKDHEYVAPEYVAPEYVAPKYDANKLEQEMDLFEHWFVTKHLQKSFSHQQLNAWTVTKQWLIESCLAQPKVWVHRDYHSRNLMVTDHNSPGVIDFQDMVLGPIGYDLASIFKDCYIEWPRDQQRAWLETYMQRANTTLGLDLNIDNLVAWVDICGLQRHLKVLGIFCRLNYRDSKTRYLADLPLVAKYVLDVLPIYPELAEFEQEFSDLIRRALEPIQRGSKRLGSSQLAPS